MKKEEIRLNIRARKTLLDDAERKSAATAVFEIIESTAAFAMAEKILMYHSLPDELSTTAFIDKWHERKSFFLPRVNGLNLEILPYNKTKLHLGAFNIEEPDGDEPTNVSEMDMIIVPGVAYDRKGNRVGRGKGYYDRLLAECDALKVGVSYHFQLVDEIESEAHDVSVDFVVTEKGILRTSHKLTH